MIYHGIRFTLKPDVTEDEVAAGLEGMRKASRAIPSIKSFVVGRVFGGEHDYGAISMLEDVEGYEEMMNHPAHLEIDRIGLPLVDRFESFDISDDPDPELGEKLAEIHQRRFDNLPDIAELVSGIGEYTGTAAPGQPPEQGGERHVEFQSGEVVGHHQGASIPARQSC
ncbi:Dabb family protein [Amycolatopsis sp. NPDC021455]|uniref:Dabb family protein n=1 Tax=Amycolatopsis sp. NPDC021455 TaxID=3154901 RepID=UPI0034040C9C